MSMSNFEPALDSPDGYPVATYPHGRRFERRTLASLINSQQRIPHTWITAEGYIIQMADMKNSHLRNTIEMLRRTSLKRLAQTAYTAHLRGERRGITIDILNDEDMRADAAWGDVYNELLSEALFRSNGDLNEWMVL